MKQLHGTTGRPFIGLLCSLMVLACPPAWAWAAEADQPATISALRKVLPEVTLENKSLEESVDLILSGIKHKVNWTRIEGAGLKRDTPVNNLKWRNVTVKQAMRVFLFEAGGNKVQLGYAIVNGVIEVDLISALKARGLPPFPTVPPTAAELEAVDAARRNGMDNLRKPLSEVSMDQKPLRECLDFLREVTNVNISANWTGLKRAGILPDTLVTVKLRDVSVSQALTAILKAAGGKNAQLVGYAVFDDGSIRISLKAEFIRPERFMSLAPSAAAARGATTQPAGSAGAAPTAAAGPINFAARLLKNADIYLASDLRDKAREKYQEVIKSFPDTPEARQAAEKLKTMAAGGKNN